MGLGYQSLLRDLGIHVGLRVWTDSSAAIGICSRQGLGKLRHLDTHTLWVQQAVRSKRVDLRKVAGEVNPADLFTKHSLTRERLMSLAKLFELEYRGGRAASAPKTRATVGTKTTLGEGVSAVGEMHGEPIMPHRVYGEEELLRRYPPLEAVEGAAADEQLEDGLLTRGIEIAEQIVKDTVAFGRGRMQKTSEGQLSREKGDHDSPG